jgi:uroporphyrinogen-III decarboxylase
MIRMQNDLRAKDTESKEKLTTVFEYKNDKAPVIINDVNYWTFGENQVDIPEKYYSDDPSVSFDYQINKIKRHYQYFPDDCYIGFLHPWFGTGVLASGFGTPIVFNYKSDPAVDISTIEKIDEVKRLELPNPETDGIMPNVIKALKHYKANSDLVVGITDCQGPLTTALSVVGYDKFCYWMHDYPHEIHTLMDKVTEALIQWVKYQKKISEIPDEGEAYPLGVRVPDGYGGAWLSDDDAVIMGADLYREFVVPYNSKFLQAFGGGCIHFCGTAPQHIENYCNTKGLLSVHNMNLDNLAEAGKMREALRKKGIVYMAGDFIPSELRLESYYGDLLDAMGSQDGLIIVPYVAPAVQLEDGKYEAANRDQLALGQIVHDILKNLLNN